MTLKLFKKLLTLILVLAKVINNNELLKFRPHFNLLLCLVISIEETKNKTL